MSESDCQALHSLTQQNCPHVADAVDGQAALGGWHSSLVSAAREVHGSVADVHAEEAVSQLTGGCLVLEHVCLLGHVMQRLESMGRC